MATGFTLLDNPNTNLRDGNYSNPRRNGATPSGTHVLHTGENATDMVGIDEGAEAVARFLSDRKTWGSYHRLVDSDSKVPVLPWRYEAYHCIYTNNWSIGISAAIQLRHWDVMAPDRRERILVNMAESAAESAWWLDKEYGIKVPPRWLTREQALARVPGFIEHGRTDPWRRTDPWDRDSDEAADFMRLYALAVGQEPAPLPTIPKPPLVVGQWPDVELWVDGIRGPVTIKAWQTLLAGIGKYEGRIDGLWHEVSVKAEQSWLRGLGYYRGLIDGWEGPMTITALQKHLTAKGLYPGGHAWWDGKRGPRTIVAEQRYLNDQRRYF